jgi:hypothetical protein
LWNETRRKRSYVSSVLARAEVDSLYKPARRLWVRAGHGRYVPSPEMLLRRGEEWVPVYETMNLAWIDHGTAGGPYRPRPAAIIGHIVEMRAEVARMRAGGSAAEPATERHAPPAPR